MSHECTNDCCDMYNDELSNNCDLHNHAEMWDCFNFMVALPATCGECGRLTLDNPGEESEHYICKPLKDVYGAEPVDPADPPSINCMYRKDNGS